MTAIDLPSYRQRAEDFCERLSREHYLHLAGHKPELEVDAIYERYSDLFDIGRVEALREAAHASDGDEARRRRYLLHFAFDGLVGNRTRAEQEEMARLEASLEVEVDGQSIGYRQIAVELANEADSERRAALAAARDEVMAERLNPIHARALEITRAACSDLGWAGPTAAYSELRALDFAALAARTDGFLRATEAAYPAVVDPQLERAGVPPLERLRRSDLPRFFRAPHLDAPFDPARMVPSLEESLAGIDVDLAAQDNVTLDAEPRPTKSPRAFCSTPRVPEEIYLVVAPVGGPGDFEALFHEAGHTEHYANVDPSLPFEYRLLGDNAVTESFAFLLESLTAEPAWLADRLGADGDEAAAQARAVKLLFLRRYSGKLAYEIELGGSSPDLGAMPARYRELVGGATGIEWPEVSWLDDVDEGFYVVCYLRAWALETHWRRALRERFGERWWESRQAGGWLRELWSQGQRLDAEELLAETVGEELDFGVLAAELGGAG